MRREIEWGKRNYKKVAIKEIIFKSLSFGFNVLEKKKVGLRKEPV